MIGIIILLAIFGIALIVMGIGGKFGYFKALYLVKGIPGFYPSGYVYAFIPIGFGSWLLAIALLMPNRKLAGDLIIISSWGVIILSIILMVWKPRWLKPWWLVWLEDHYAYALTGMLEEARNTKDFEQQTRTEVELAAWADSVAQKNGW